MADRTPSPKSSTDAPEVHPADELKQDGVPDILEIFGAAPLVDAELDLAEDDTERLVTPDKNDQFPELDTEEPARDTPSPPESSPIDADAAPADAAPASEVPAAAEASAASEAPAAPETPAATPAPASPAAPQLDSDATRTLTEAVSGTVMLLEQRMGSLEETLDSLAKQNSFIPPKLRGLGKKVDELSSSIADGRLRELCGELVSLVDLLDAGLAETQDENARRTLSAVSLRLKQSLEARGLSDVDTDGEFDPTRHQSVERRVVHDAAQNGMVVEVFRRGWRDAHSVLRYADVAVGAFEAPAAEPQAADTRTPSDDVALEDELPDNGSDLAPTTLTPGNVRAPAAPRRNEPTGSFEDEGDTDRTAAKASSRNTKNDNKDNA
ncbi:MAG: hypothetical protein DHS20C15_07800 [Planctomycetota bacterium]|nr:MAG: hypothetical protein DHS20C15_07800 [Planctomycetota bacterium]